MKDVRAYYYSIIEGRSQGIFSVCARGALFLFSGMYGVLNILNKKSHFIRRKRLNRPVISVGNITWGGTGKTPLVQWLIDYYTKKGTTVAVLMRGYGNDENKLLEHNNPGVVVLSGSRRYESARTFLKENDVDLFILDDGFQHWPLARDLDIVTINCVNPWGNGKLIPAGPLREELANLVRADLVVLTNAESVSTLEKERIKNVLSSYVDVSQVCEARHAAESLYKASMPDEKYAPEFLNGSEAILFSGIGTPAAFRATVERAGVKVREHLVFPDHHAYTENDLLRMKRVLEKEKLSMCLTTEKDFMRNERLLTQVIDPYILTIRMEILTNYDAFICRLDRFISH
jgi:tetraacyldisaccharide 4'-kinase